MPACTCLNLPHPKRRQNSSTMLLGGATKGASRYGCPKKYKTTKKRRVVELQTRTYHTIHYLHRTNYPVPVGLTSCRFPRNQRRLKILGVYNTNQHSHTANTSGKYCSLWIYPLWSRHTLLVYFLLKIFSGILKYPSHRQPYTFTPYTCAQILVHSSGKKHTCC